MATAAPIDALARALDATGELVGGVREDQWSNRTPCPEWDVRTLINHLVGGNRMFAAILRSQEPLPPETLRQMREVDYLGNDPAGAFREAGADLLAAFGQPGVLDRVVQVPAGAVPGAAALHLRITENLVHGWDLARATGQAARLPDDLVEEELAFAHGPAPDVPRTGHPFGPPQPVPDDAPLIDQLAAYFGRPVPADPAEPEGA